MASLGASTGGCWRVANRDPYSRWRRLPPVFRSGEHKIPGPGDDQERIILYLRGDILDQAEAQAKRAGVPTLQEYCAALLARAIEIERVKHHVEDVEAKRGTLEGFSAISDDPEYLAEWRERSGSSEIPAAGAQSPGSSASRAMPELTVEADTLGSVTLPMPPDSTASAENQSLPEPRPESAEAGEQTDRPRVRIEQLSPAIGLSVPERIVPEVLDGTAVSIVLRHVDPAGRDPRAFLPSLRRAQPVSRERGAELMAALERIESDHLGVSMLDRQLSYALHRLSLESQVLITEAFPGVIDDRTVGLVRAVQEMVERILSGEDIRYDQPRENPAAEEPS
jgi:hypothetical protein